jgi:type II secretory pathway component PulL
VATNVLALHTAAGWVTAAVAESTLRSSRITGLAAAPAGSAQITELLASRRWDRVICALPARAAYYRFLDLPFRDHRRLAQAVGPALEEHVPLSLDEGMTAFDTAGARRSGRVLAAMVRRSTIEDLSKSVEALGLTPSQWVWEPTAVLAAYRPLLDPEQATVVVDVGIDCTVVAACDKGEIAGIRVISAATEPGFARDLGWAVRTLEMAAERAVLGGHHHEIAAETVAAVLDDVRVELLPNDCPVALADRAKSAWRGLTTVVGLVLVASGSAEPPVVSFTGSGVAPEAATTERRELLRRFAPWAAATGVLLALAAGLDTARLMRHAARQDRVAERIFSTAMPGVPGGGGLRMKLDLKLEELLRRQAELQGGTSADSALGILVAMSEAVPGDVEVEFESYAFDPPNVRLRGQASSFETVTRLQEILRTSTSYQNVDVSDVRSAASGEGVQFELTIRLGGAKPDA